MSTLTYDHADRRGGRPEERPHARVFARLRRARSQLARAGGLAALVACICPGMAQASFQLGLEDLQHLNPQTAPFAFGAFDAVAGSTIRLGVSWQGVAPGGTNAPAGFAPRNPGDPQYSWGEFDRAVRSAAQRHLNVLMMLFQAPAWAEGPDRPNNPDILPGAWDPSPAKFADFAHAAATRYSGHYPDPLHPGTELPRVRYWEIWNEQNLPFYLAAPDLVGEYRALLNDSYNEIKAVDQGNVVVTGGLAPVSFLGKSVSPLLFATELMCMHRVGTTFRANRSCPQRARFDIFSHHPYSLAATPTKPAYNPDDVLVADMGKLSRLLQTADRLHTIAPSVPHHLWVTEWGWLTDPPNTQLGDSANTAARYIAYAMYQMWRSGVQLVIWQTIRDVSYASPLGGGLYWSSGKPKPSLSAFAFPVIASVARGQGFVWGRAPVLRRTQVVVERAAAGRWQVVASTTTGSDGVFQARFRAGGNGTYRARVFSGSTSLAYDSGPIPPRRTHMFNSG